MASTLLGLHSHFSPEHTHAATSHQAHSSNVAVQLSIVHLAEHQIDDDIDVDNSGLPAVKLQFTAPLLLVFYCSLIVLVLHSRTMILRSAERPLRPPRRSYLLPPSQAPPHAA